MKLKTPKNINYCCTVVQLRNIIPLAKCDNLVATNIFGNNVIVGKDVNIGDVGLFFPVECRLSNIYLKNNNLFRHSENNLDNEKVGYFEDNGRVRCVKLRGHNSEGLFMPLSSITFTGTDPLNIGDQFDEVNDIPICEKYVVKQPRTPGQKNQRDKKIKESRILDNQFRLHIDTSQLGANLHRINPDDLIQISYKVHGTSAIFSKVLCRKPLSWYEKALLWLGVNIVDVEYSNIYSSRKVIKNQDISPNSQHYYSEDIWTIVNEEIKDYLLDGLTIYAEIIGFLPNGGAIQKDYDYGCNPGEHKVFVYRITYTNIMGKVFEFSGRQVQEWCKLSGLVPVPELFYGFARDLCPTMIGLDKLNWNTEEENLDLWRISFLNKVKEKYTDKQCYLSKNKVPEEGCVVRLENLGIHVFKCKSPKFLLKETMDLDKGIIDIESDN